MSDIKGFEISDLLGLSEPVGKLVETVSRGVGILYEPRKIRKNAEANAEAIKTIGKALRQNPGVPSRYDDGKIFMNSEYSEDLIDRASQRFLHQEIAKQENIDSVISYGITEIEKETTVSEKKVETDWILRFMNSVEDISDVNMQELWGKILAGEVKQPSTYSFRTLNILKNISNEEAKTFEKITPFVIAITINFFIDSRQSILDKYNIDFRDLLLLEECGLIKTADLTLSYNLEKDGKPIIIYNSEVIGVISNIQDKVEEVSLNTYQLTEVGIQLFKTLQPKGNKEYLIDVIKEIRKELSEENLSFKAHKLEGKQEGGEFFTHHTQDLL